MSNRSRSTNRMEVSSSDSEIEQADSKMLTEAVQNNTGEQRGEEFDFRRSRFLDRALLMNSSTKHKEEPISVQLGLAADDESDFKTQQLDSYHHQLKFSDLDPNYAVERGYICSKLESLQRTSLSLEEYRCGLMSHLQHITALREHVEKEEDRLKAQRTRQRAPLAHGFVGSQALEEFYKFDRPEPTFSRGLEIMRLIERRRKLEAHSQVNLGEVIISSSSESEDEQDQRQNKPALKYDFEDRKTYAWRNTQEDAEDYENFDSVVSHDAKMEVSEDGVSSQAVEQLGKRSSEPQHTHNHEQLLSSIVLESGLTPGTIRKHNLVELAAKKNTVKHLQTTSVPIRGIDIYRSYLKWYKINRKPQEWSTAENERLAKYVDVFSDTRWKQISILMDGRTPYECRRQWFQKVSPFRQTVRWDNPADDLLIGLGTLEWSKGKRVKWAKVANLFEGRRNELQVRERYANILDPGLGAISAEPTLEVKVFELYHQLGNKWSKIAKNFPGLTDNQVKRIVERALRKQDGKDDTDSNNQSDSCSSSIQEIKKARRSKTKVTKHQPHTAQDHPEKPLNPNEGQSSTST
jgi:Myb-like DNA-binding domain